MFEKWNFIPDNEEGTLKQKILEEKLHQWNEIKEEPYEGEKLKTIKDNIGILSFKVAFIL